VGDFGPGTFQRQQLMMIAITALLILHGLVGVALLGAITHQLVSMYRRRTVRSGSFIDRYTGVNQQIFVVAVISLFITQVVLGAIIYPTYRLDVRIPFEEMFLFKAVGVFEMKEHFAGLGIGMLPLYFWLWRSEIADTHHRDRIAITSVLAFIVWWDFLIGHILNNIRGFS
jgi:hypothetical protein